MKRFFLFIGNLAACIVENFKTLTGLWRATALQNSFDKVSDEIKPHRVQNIALKEKKFRRNRLEFQPSFIVKLLFISFAIESVFWGTKQIFLVTGNLFVICLDEQ